MPNTPNLIYVFPDQLRQAAIGAYAQDPVITPNLDRFASESVVFTNAVSNCPICSPYRGMLLTGKYPLSNGVVTNCHSQSHVELRKGDRCFSDVLHDAGYSCGYVGKWHLDRPNMDEAHYTEGVRADGRLWDGRTPPERRHGFDFWHSYGCCDQHLTPHYWEGDAPVERRTDVNEWSVEHETDTAIDYLRNTDRKFRDPSKPFALFVAYNPPHTPFDEVPQQYVDLYKDKSTDELLNRPNVAFEGYAGFSRKSVHRYFGAVSGIDMNFGRILSALEEQGLSDNTIVVFTSDHGEMMGSQGRMHKDTWYDESLLVPFIMRWPGVLKHRTDDLLLSVPDIMPTLLGMMGLRQRIPEDIDGVNYSSPVMAEVGRRPEFAPYCFFDTDHFEDYTRTDCHRRGLRTHTHTFAVVRKPGDAQQLYLFDNQTDPYQQENIAARECQLVSILACALDGWMAKTGDPWAGTLEECVEGPSSCRAT